MANFDPIKQIDAAYNKLYEEFGGQPSAQQLADMYNSIKPRHFPGAQTIFGFYRPDNEDVEFAQLIDGVWFSVDLLGTRVADVCSMLDLLEIEIIEVKIFRNEGSFSVTIRRSLKQITIMYD